MMIVAESMLGFGASIAVEFAYFELQHFVKMLVDRPFVGCPGLKAEREG